MAMVPRLVLLLVGLSGFVESRPSRSIEEQLSEAGAAPDAGGRRICLVSTSLCGPPCAHGFAIPVRIPEAVVAAHMVCRPDTRCTDLRPRKRMQMLGIHVPVAGRSRTAWGHNAADAQRRRFSYERRSTIDIEYGQSYT